MVNPNLAKLTAALSVNAVRCSLPQDVMESLLKVFSNEPLTCETTVISEADAKFMPWYESHEGLWQNGPRETALIFVDNLVLYKELARDEVHIWDLTRARELTIQSNVTECFSSLLNEAFEDSILNEGVIGCLGHQASNHFVIDVFQCFLGETDAHRVMQGLYSVIPDSMSLPFRFKRTYGFKGLAVERKSEDKFDENGFPEWESCTFQDYLTSWMEMTV